MCDSPDPGPAFLPPMEVPGMLAAGCCCCAVGPEGPSLGGGDVPVAEVHIQTHIVFGQK